VSEKTTHFGYQSIAATQKTERVAAVFRSVAPHYDLMNDLMSFGLHRLWKRLMVARCMIQPGHWVLDLAGGTADLTVHFAKRIKGTGKVILTDINEVMLDESRKRLLNAGIIKPISLIQANAEALPFLNNTFDRIAMAFGLRNVTYKEQALKEMQRVLKPGGRAVILEFSEVRSQPLSTLYNAYSFSVLPCLGKLICQDAESYRYLAESIRRHPNQETLKEMMSQAGFLQCEYQNIHSGIVALHIGYKF
jgi:demethylmenaquinone methyltransferase/2-methoxy-6-polyprenyl-1,4-benzoquinol methylase